MCHIVSFMLPNVNELRAIVQCIARELGIRTDLLVSLTQLINFPIHTHSEDRGRFSDTVAGGVSISHTRISGLVILSWVVSSKSLLPSGVLYPLAIKGPPRICEREGPSVRRQHRNVGLLSRAVQPVKKRLRG